MMATMASTNAAAAVAPQDKSERVTTTATPTATAVDTALFGSLNASIADTLTERIDTALKAGVSTLPFMNDNDDDTSTDTCSEKLLAVLRSIYWRNVDVFEVYAGRNIFSVGIYLHVSTQAPPNRFRPLQ
jgi:hypothetical protein